jgi:nucleotide-binding universal stress UspA family protein
MAAFGAAAGLAAARGKLLKRSGTFGHKSKTLLVAIDGSATSMRALRLAVFMMNEDAKDIIRVITIRSTKEGADDPAKLMQAARGELIQLGVQPGKIKADPIREVLDIDSTPGSDLPSTICFEASRDPNTLLIMGAAGKNAEGAAASAGKRAKGQAPMGHIAETVMQQCTTPVLLVKGLATPGLDSNEGMMRRRMRQSHDEARLTVVCAVTSEGDLSRECFDLSARFARTGDSVKVVHVQDIAGTTDVRVVRSYFEGECRKQEEAKPGTSFTYHNIPKKGSVRETLLTKVEDWLADVLVLGSVELATAKPGVDGAVLGSVSSAVAKKTQCHTLIAKSFKGV